MSEFKILKPIENTINYWIDYQKCQPRVPYEENQDLWHEYRKSNDLSCKFLVGEVDEDKILNGKILFSLWQPLKLTLRIIDENIDYYIQDNKLPFIQEHNGCLEYILENLLEFLPVEETMVRKLSRLFELGMARANVVALPSLEMRNMVEHDYMPEILEDSFQVGRLSKFFQDDNHLRNWIKKENLSIFFEDRIIEKDRIRDLTGIEYAKNIMDGSAIEYDRNIKEDLVLKEKETALGIEGLLSKHMNIMNQQRVIELRGERILIEYMNILEERESLLSKK